jgi:O-antigen ligase
MSQIATLIFIVGICGLFYLDRDPEARTSKALWLPVVWLWIAGSRPVSEWQTHGIVSSADQYMDGSPIDRNIFVVLLAIGMVVLFGRAAAVLKLLRANGPIVLFLLFCAASVLWSDYPDIAFKRWIKSLGDYVMILIVLTDPDRISAIKRVLARAGFVLLPGSVLLIKYFPELGRKYATHWDSTVYFTGVSADKNMLGVACLIFGLGSMWRFLQELRAGKGQRRNGSLIAHGAVIAIDCWLFWKINSMTSLSCFVLGTGLIVATIFPTVARKRAVVHAMVAACVAFCFCVLFLGFGGFLLAAAGRNPTLTGRTELWETLRGMTVNPVLGAGFESFWLGKRLEKLWSIYWWQPNESHNGYLETYLNLGWTGLVLLVGIMMTGYQNLIRQLGEGLETAPLRLAFFFVGVAYNFTEAAIRTVSPVWISFILAVMVLPKTPVPFDVPETLPRLAGSRKKATLSKIPERIPA